MVGHPQCRGQQRLAQNCLRQWIGDLESDRQSQGLLEDPKNLNGLDPFDTIDTFCLKFNYKIQFKNILTNTSLALGGNN